MTRLLLLVFVLSLHADEGMWTFNNFPSEKVRAKYGFSPSKEWLDHVRLASVRLAEGCSASLVSPNGLVLTNHHCAANCIQEVSTAEKDYSAKGYQAKSGSEEIRCPGQEANILDSISNVTDRITAATKGMPDKAANDARKAEIAKLEKECATTDAMRCEVISLYGGGIYDLYRYRRYQDVRLVFAPEFAAAFFGGDPDNFMFPRYDLDMSMLRIYDNGQPLKTPQYFPISRSGPKAGDLTFVSGNPGGTDRQHTVAMLEHERDFVQPHLLYHFSEYRGLLTMFQTRGEEQRRVSQDELFGVENTLKAIKGQEESLLQKNFFEQKRKEEREFQQRIQANPKLRAEYGKVWDDVTEAVKQLHTNYLAYIYFERNWGFRSDSYRQARRLLRMAEEYPKPNEKRLTEYADARKPELSQLMLSTAPISAELEIETLTFSLTKLREVFSVDDPRIKQIFGKQSPREIATAAVNGTQLRDVAVRKSLMEGGKQAVDASKDPMIALARLVDPIARAVRTKYEDEAESALTRAREKLAKARFAAYGSSLYPDATFTLRLSYGQVKGWSENGTPVAPFTIFGGAFERATGRAPYALPQSWLDAQSKLNLQTPFNFVSTNDIIGGNSGSPVLNQDAQVVGLIFDGNIHSLGGNYGFDESVNRAVAVDTTAILEALEKVYGAERVLSELTLK
jgi:Peptidase S46